MSTNLVIVAQILKIEMHKFVGLNQKTIFIYINIFGYTKIKICKTTSIYYFGMLCG